MAEVIEDSDSKQTSWKKSFDRQLEECLHSTQKNF